MNLWFRLIWYALTARWRPGVALPHGISRLGFRVWPSDLDTSLHMNNGRYLTLMDLGRLDVMVAGGLARAVVRHRWTPVASAIKIRFRRELRLWQRFRIETRIVAWDQLNVVMEQVFIIEGGRHDRQIAAYALFKGGLYDRKARKFVAVERLMAEVGVTAESPPPSPDIAAFLEVDAAMKLATSERATDNRFDDPA